MEYVYAALMLHKLGKEINEENLKKIVTAAGASADEAKIKTLLASLKGLDIDAELANAAVAVAAPAQGPAAEKKEEKKEEKHEMAAEGLASLFG